MLDKSIPYFNLIMYRNHTKQLPNIELPKGYSIVNFSDGDEEHWANIETSVGEFDNFDEALNYFKLHYLPFGDELKKRCLFVQNSVGEKVGTFTIWWDHKNDQQIPSVHWVGVLPKFQGLGLGKAIVLAGIKKSIEINGAQDIYLHTQTWSYKAIAVYMKAGFELLKNETFSTYPNDYEHALPYLCQKLGLDV